MSTLLEIESAINELSLPDLAVLERIVRQELQQRRSVTPADATAPPRVLGLHAGAWAVAEDFDAPLPEDFWLGTANQVAAWQVRVSRRSRFDSE